MKEFLIPRIVFLFYRILLFTWRIRIVEHPETTQRLSQGQPFIIAHWHGDELALLYLVKKYRLATMTSTSKDGAIIDYVIKKLGGNTSRGSSTRQGVQALKGLIRLCKNGFSTSVAVDGPKGPIYEVKPGVFEVSKLSGNYIVPTAPAVSSKKEFPKAWNKTYLPMPFSKVIIYIDKPFDWNSKITSPKSSELARTLGQQIFYARQQASKIIAGQ